MNIGNIFTALRAGWVLSNPAAVKDTQQLINAIVALLTVLFAVLKGFGYEFPISEGLLKDIAGGFVAVAIVFNLWATPATTDKISVVPFRRPPSAPDDSGSTG